MHVVAVLALEGVVGFELAMPCQVFGSAQAADGEHLYDVRVCSAAGDIKVSAAGHPAFRMLAAHGLDALAGADTVLVPAHESGGPVPTDVIEALRRIHSHGTRVASICTGAEVLAEAGLLDGRPAATHWRHAARIARRYPRVRFDASVLFVDDGAVLTGAGVSAGIDLCLHMIRRDHGAAVAASVARRIVMAPERRGGQAQFIPTEPVVDDRLLGPTLRWARERLHRQLSLDELAGHASVSVRTLIRRFREQTSQTPLQWLIGQRLQLARELLETTGLDVEIIARRCGFGGATTLRHHFRRQLATTPTGYRQALRPGHVE